MTGGSSDQVACLNAEIKYLKAQNAQLQDDINRRDINSKTSVPATTNLLRTSENSNSTADLERKMKEMSIELDCLRADNQEVRISYFSSSQALLAC